MSDSREESENRQIPQKKKEQNTQRSLWCGVTGTAPRDQWEEQTSACAARQIQNEPDRASHPPGPRRRCRGATRLPRGSLRPDLDPRSPPKSQSGAWRLESSPRLQFHRTPSLHLTRFPHVFPISPSPSFYGSAHRRSRLCRADPLVTAAWNGTYRTEPGRWKETEGTGGLQPPGPAGAA